MWRPQVQRAFISVTAGRDHDPCSQYATDPVLGAAYCALERHTAFLTALIYPVPERF
jgi:hypothetical protein